VAEIYLVEPSKIFFRGKQGLSLRELAILVKVDIFDWEGNLYETYQYSNLKLNVGLTDFDFDPANPAYNFRIDEGTY